MLTPSTKSTRTNNPIRDIVDNLSPPKDHPKPMMNLGLGDPTAHGNLNCPEVVKKAMTEAINKGANNGYLPSFGSPAARVAIAKYTSRPGATCDPEGVLICSGASGALEITLGALMNEGDNILVPRPGFPLYQVISEALGGSVKHYSVLPQNNWECDLAQMDNLVDNRTRAILINNPSNPCGSNFSKQHLIDIAAIARKHGLPIIADEIYGNMVYDGEFTPLHTVAGDVPVFTIGGIAKEFVVPGWRVGWVVVTDNSEMKVASQIITAMRKLSMLIIGANSLVIGILPAILTPEENGADHLDLVAFNDSYVKILADNAVSIISYCNNIDALAAPSPPQGAMYAMIGIEFDKLNGKFADDVEFCNALLQEENMLVLPGACFGMKGFFRLVTCPPKHKIEDAMQRLADFCKRYQK